MRPLPRLLAIADDAVCQADDFPIRAAAILSVGPSVAIVIRSIAPEARGYLLRVRSLARPSEGGVFGYANESIAKEAGAQGLIVPGDSADWSVFRRRPRGATPPDGPGPSQPRVPAEFGGAIGCEVQSIVAAKTAADAGADFLVVGPTGSAGPAEWWTPAMALGRPVFLPGDGTDDHRTALRATGAYGLAVGPTLWRSRDPAETTAALVGTWAPG
ncbi:MAG: hypothetical protein ACKVZ0_07700 [Gemmatimonadales bacterium]